MRKSVGIVAVVAMALLLGLSGSAGAKVGAKCGGALGSACGAGEFCEHATGACSPPDLVGTCARVPEFCAMIFQPVCGCNGRTFANDCERQRDRVSKAHDEKCQ
jgi:Kazal-type serine protease inhibitor domain